MSVLIRIHTVYEKVNFGGKKAADDTKSMKNKPAVGDTKVVVIYNAMSTHYKCIICVSTSSSAFTYLSKVPIAGPDVKSGCTLRF